MKAKVSILAKPYPYISFTLQLDSAWESSKRTTVALLPSFSHMAWERGYKPTPVASFSGHFLAPPIWPGNEASMIQQYAL